MVASAAATRPGPTGKDAPGPRFVEPRPGGSVLPVLVAVALVALVIAMVVAKLRGNDDRVKRD